MTRERPNDLQPLDLASGTFLARKDDRRRLIGQLKAHGLRIYLIAGREFVSEAEWQRTLVRIAEEVR